MGHSIVRARWRILVPLAALVALLVGAVPAAAHSDLTSSDPADGAFLATAPAAVSLTFNEDLLAQGNAILLTEVATGTRLELGAVSVEGSTVSAAWPPASPAGQFRADYRVVSADGHPIDGSVTFTVEAAVGAPTPEQVADAEPSPSAVPADAVPSPSAVPADPESSPSAVPADPDAAAAQGEAGTGVLIWVLGLGLVLLAGAGLGTRYTRRSR